MQNYIKCNAHVNEICKENLEFHEDLIETLGTIEFPKGIQLQILVI